jgi:hypothetical protein
MGANLRQAKSRSTGPEEGEVSRLETSTAEFATKSTMYVA